MSLPGSALEIVAVVVLFVPGFVFAVVRVWRRGARGDDRGIDTRVAQALVVSVIFDAVYLLFAYSVLPPLVIISASEIEIVDPVALGFTILAGAVVLPGALAFAVYWPWQRQKYLDAQGVARHRRMRRWNFDGTPTAWDWSAGNPQTRFVRVLLPDGKWVGGVYARDSFVSTYPEQRDMFISAPWVLSLDGTFVSENEESDGLWLSIPDGAIVEWMLTQETWSRAGGTSKTGPAPDQTQGGDAQLPANLERSAGDPSRGSRAVGTSVPVGRPPSSPGTVQAPKKQ